jgi:hypothetical protein
MNRPPIPIDLDELEPAYDMARADETDISWGEPDYGPYDDAADHRAHEQERPFPQPRKTRNPWFAVHNEIVESIEYRKLSGSARSTLIDLMSFASRFSDEGVVPSPSDLLRVYPAGSRETEKNYEALVDRGLLVKEGAKYRLTKWSWQPKRDNSRERVQKHRAQLKVVS